DPTLRLGPGGGEPMPNLPVADLLQPVGPQRGSPANLRRSTGQYRPAGLFLRRGSRDIGLGGGRLAGRLPLFCKLELAPVLRFPFVAVLIGYKAVSVPKGSGRRLDRLLPYRLQIHRAGLCWSINIRDGSMIGRWVREGSRWRGGWGSISAG